MDDVEKEEPVEVPLYLAMWEKVLIVLIVYFALASVIAGISISRHVTHILPDGDGYDASPEQEFLIGAGYAPRLAQVGDRYAILVQNNGLELIYSDDCRNWSQPVRVSDWRDPLRYGTQGCLLRRSGGEYLLAYAQQDQASAYELRILVSESGDGYNWSAPRILNMSPIRIWQLYAISMAETSVGEVILAISGEEFGIATMTTTNGIDWQGPDRRRSLDEYGGVSIIETNDRIYIAYGDRSVVWLGYWKDAEWQVSRVTPQKLFTYTGLVSMTQLNNGLMVIAFDHQDSVYLTASRDMQYWDYPFNVSKGSMPTIAPFGASSLILAYNHEERIYARIVDLAEWTVT